MIYFFPLSAQFCQWLGNFVVPHLYLSVFRCFKKLRGKQETLYDCFICGSGRSKLLHVEQELWLKMVAGWYIMAEQSDYSYWSLKKISC